MTFKDLHFSAFCFGRPGAIVTRGVHAHSHRQKIRSRHLFSHEIGYVRIRRPSF